MAISHKIIVVQFTIGAFVFPTAEPKLTKEAANFSVR